MTAEHQTNDASDDGLPPRAVLYALYAVFALVLIAVLVIVGVYI